MTVVTNMPFKVCLCIYSRRNETEKMMEKEDNMEDWNQLKDLDIEKGENFLVGRIYFQCISKRLSMNS